MRPNTIDPRAFEFVLNSIHDGFIFEDFAQSFCSHVLGFDFLPVGGLKDRGIDGIQHLFHRKSFETQIFQMSIESDAEGKIINTIDKLKENKINLNKFSYVTNRIVSKKDSVTELLFDKYSIPVQIFDLAWFIANANYSEGTFRAYSAFVNIHLHEYEQPGKAYVVDDLLRDPRLFVFLRQQWESNKQEFDLDIILADTLILFALEGTDPDKNALLKENEIISKIEKLIGFDPRQFREQIRSRLHALSTKPRKINHHLQEDAFCLPYETRKEIQERNLVDSQLFMDFKKDSETILKKYLKLAEVKVNDCIDLIINTINRIFYQQGLEFSDFVLRGENPEAFEKEIVDVIGQVISQSSVIPKNREAVKSVLLLCIREIVYQGTLAQKTYLQKLSNTYMMLFLLQCDPKLCTFFSTLASKLQVYVCTSIIIPALSEFYLEEINKRHWNLLKGAHGAGVKLIVNDTILNELVGHFQMIINKYEAEYKEYEDIYLLDEAQILYIDEVMIRSYFYSKLRNQVKDFYSFIDNFVTPSLYNAKSEIIQWLHEEFGIEYLSDASQNVVIDDNDVDNLFEALKPEKSHPTKARNKAKLILTIYALRTLRNETDGSGVFGYYTWWLSKDSVTHPTLQKVLGDKYDISCYMRPDFLYNYISFAPNKQSVDATYNTLFPSFLGINISYHLPKEVIDTVHNLIKQHKDKNHTRLQAVLRTLIEKIKEDPSFRTKKKLILYFDEQLAQYEQEKAKAPNAK